MLTAYARARRARERAPGRRTATGFVVALIGPTRHRRGEPEASRVIDETPLVPPPSIALARWVASARPDPARR
jgi:hypothetical protein